MQGVSINIFVKTGLKGKGEKAKVYHQNLFGSREQKYANLNDATLSTILWNELTPAEPYYFFVPKDFSVQDEYERGYKVDDLMIQHSNGIVTGKDGVCICSTEIEANNLYRDLLKLSIEDFRSKYNPGKDTKYWSIKNAKEDVSNATNNNKCQIVRCLFRPFDIKYTIYTGKSNGVLQRPIDDNSKYMLTNNVGMVIPRQTTQDWRHVFLSKYMIDGNLTSSARLLGAGQLFPLYLTRNTFGVEERIPNLNPQIVQQIEQSLGEQVEPQDLFDYIYAVLHSPNYRERYKEFLKIDFPRIPYPTDREKFRNMVEKGAELRKLHLMEDLPTQPGVTFPVGGSMQVEQFRWQEGRVYINNEQYFEGVPESAWNFYIGGYQPAQKWLKDRKGMTLGFEDVMHYQRIIYVLLQTEQIMQEIDKINN